MPLRDSPKNGKIQSFAEYKAGLDGIYQGSMDEFTPYNNKSPNAESAGHAGIAREKWEQGDKKALNSQTVNEAKRIKVKSNILPKIDAGGTEKFLTVIFEQNSAHPNGEIFIADSEIHEVAVTERVRQKLIDGELIEVETA